MPFDPLRGERARVRRDRAPRPSPNAERQVRSRDETALASLKYRKGHLTDAELAILAKLRGPLTEGEQLVLARAARTLRRPEKRLKALDLMRRWGEPLTLDQERMLPWFAGLTWHRPLAAAPSLAAVDLARHLLCLVDVPEFLLEPFAHPDRYKVGVHWDLCRLLAAVGAGHGLGKLGEIDAFWTWVPDPVFTDFLETPAGVPVVEGLIRAFVCHWDGPEWLARQAFTWTRMVSMSWDLPPVLRVAQERCLDPLPPRETQEVALARLVVVRNQRRNFGTAPAFPLPGVVPPELAGWSCHPLRTPSDFEAEDLGNDGHTSWSFHDALRGRVSVWSLRREDRRITLWIDVQTLRFRYTRTTPREGDVADAQVVTVWARANGLCD